MVQIARVSRKCGVKPQSPAGRAAAVTDAVRVLEKVGAPFSVADVAARSGVSRATIYRSDELRRIVGAKGDGPRFVQADIHAKLAERHEETKATTRELRRRLNDIERSWDEMRERALKAERKLLDAEQRIKQLEAQKTPARQSNPLASIALGHGQEAIRRARRHIARALHPDLFAKDPIASAIATELLKTVNTMAE